MANPEHLKIIKQGAEVWNEWREKNPAIKPNLRGADLRGASLRGLDLRDADLSLANLNRVYLPMAKLSGANLDTAFLVNANLSGANLINASLRDTYLSSANLTMANLSGANLSRANLSRAFLIEANLSGSDFSGAINGWTIFADIDLSIVNGLESVQHNGPSTIGVDTIYKSRGNIPEVFLRRAGVPENFITYMHSLAEQSIQFYSCFISYSSKNQTFADRLYADLLNKGVRCWLASEDLKIGAKTRVAIDESIRVHDKLLLVLSKHSVESDWVEQEVETALDRERKEKRTVLFPIRLDDEVMKIDSGWPALIKNSRNIGDFRKWRNPEAYQKVLDRLLRDLKAGE